MYQEELVVPMRKELTDIGFLELKTPEDVDKELSGSNGTVLVVVNSVCGCAAGNARPGVRMALENEIKPDKLFTVFAGQDREATEKARSFFTDFSPSSPSMALLKDGKVVFMLERHSIEGHSPEIVAGKLKWAFDNYCK
jgi:putative YphP/YqiW family bacilliredoxin